MMWIIKFGSAFSLCWCADHRGCDNSSTAPTCGPIQARRFFFFFFFLLFLYRKNEGFAAIGVNIQIVPSFCARVYRNAVVPLVAFVYAERERGDHYANKTTTYYSIVQYRQEGGGGGGEGIRRWAREQRRRPSSGAVSTRRTTRLCSRAYTHTHTVRMEAGKSGVWIWESWKEKENTRRQEKRIGWGNMWFIRLDGVYQIRQRTPLHSIPHIQVVSQSVGRSVGRPSAFIAQEQ